MNNPVKTAEITFFPGEIPSSVLRLHEFLEYPFDQKPASNIFSSPLNKEEKSAPTRQVQSALAVVAAPLPLPLQLQPIVFTQPQDLTETIKKQKAAERGNINGISYTVSFLNTVMLAIPAILETITSTLGNVAAETSILEQHPEAFLALAILVSILIVYQGMRYSKKYRDTNLENSKEERLARDRRTAIDGAVGSAAIAYALTYSITKAFIPDPTGFIPATVALSVATVVGIFGYFIIDLQREYFTAEPKLKNAEKLNNESVANQRLMMARLWGLVNAMSYAGNVTMLFSIGYIAIKFLTALASSASFTTSLALSGPGLFISLGLSVIALVAFGIYGAKIYGDIEQKKQILETKSAALEKLATTDPNYAEAKKEHDLAKNAYDVAKGKEEHFRRHRLVIGAALTKFNLIMAIGFSLAALASPIPLLALTIAGLTLVVATIVACHSVAKGVAAYDNSNAPVPVDDQKAHLFTSLYKGTISILPMLSAEPKNVLSAPSHENSLVPT